MVSVCTVMFFKAIISSHVLKYFMKFSFLLIVALASCLVIMLANVVFANEMVR